MARGRDGRAQSAALAVGSRRPALAAASAVAAAAALVAGLMLVPAAAVSAHDYLVSSSPTAGSTVVTPPDSVSLTFNDVVLDLSGPGSSAIVEVTGPDASTAHFETGCASIQGRSVSVPVALGGPGNYVVTWQVVSSDGHQVSDSLSFTYAPSAGAASTTGAAAPAACGRSVSTALPPAGGASTDTGSVIAILGTAGGIVLLAVIGVVVILVVSRSRSRSERKSRKDDGGPIHPESRSE